MEENPISKVEELSVGQSIALETLIGPHGNSDQLTKAVKNEKYLQMFAIAHTEKEDCEVGFRELTAKWKAWMTERNFEKMIPFLRFPLKTASLIDNDIRPELEKVFASGDSNEDIRMISLEQTNSAKNYLTNIDVTGFIRGTVWPALFFQHNSIVVTDIANNDPYNLLITIESVRAINVDENSNIHWLWFEMGKRHFVYTSESYNVFLQIDDKDNYQKIISGQHDLGKCPAHFISDQPISKDRPIVRKSIFGNHLADFERIAWCSMYSDFHLPNGGGPIITKYKRNNGFCSTQFGQHKCQHGIMVDHKTNIAQTCSQGKTVRCPNCNSAPDIQAGAVVEFKVPEYGLQKDKLFDLNENFLKYVHAPVELTQYLESLAPKYCEKVRKSVVGTEPNSGNEQAMNELQNKKQLFPLENSLNTLSESLSKLRSNIQWTVLALKWGADNVISAKWDYGTQFYLQSDTEIKSERDSSKNPVDHSIAQSKLIATRNRNNPNQALRESLLYNLLPFNHLSDEQVESSNIISEQDKKVRLNYNWLILEMENQLGTSLEDFFSNYFPDDLGHGKRYDQFKNYLYQLSVKQTIKKQQIK